MTPLHYAVKKGHYEFVKYLVEQKQILTVRMSLNYISFVINSTTFAIHDAVELL